MPDMDYFPKNHYSSYSRQWGIIYHEQYKVLTENKSDVNSFIFYYITEILQDVQDAHRLVPLVTF